MVLYTTATSFRWEFGFYPHPVKRKSLSEFAKKIERLFFGSQFPPQPGLCVADIVTDDVDREIEGFCSFFRRHSAEESHFDYFSQGFVHSSQGFESTVQFEQIQ